MISPARAIRDSPATPMHQGEQDMSVKRMDNVLIVVDDLEAVKAFFIVEVHRQQPPTQVKSMTRRGGCAPLVGAWRGLCQLEVAMARFSTAGGVQRPLAMASSGQ